ncbi:MAG: hypothetical protein KBS57_00180, partial [Alistipes sp.]|nr:hypothetical protein [Candidatus Minthomonas equi]
CSVGAVILISAIGWYFHTLLSREMAVSSSAASDSCTAALCAVPMDAVTVFQTNSLSGAGGTLALLAPDYNVILSSLPEGGLNYAGAISVHNTGKNKLSLLLVGVIPETADGSAIIGDVLSGCAGVIRKDYESSVIYKSSVPDLNFALCGHFLLCSSSVTLLESSIRLLESGESLLDVPIFLNSIKNSRSGESVIFNHNSIANLISGVFRPSYRKYSAFISRITDWSCFDIGRDEDGVVQGRGTFSQSDEKSCYSYVLGKQKGSRSDVTDVLPYNTESVTSMRISNLESLITRYSLFKRSLGRGKQNVEKIVSTAEKYGVIEVAKAIIRTPDGPEAVVMVKSDKSEYFGAGEEADTCAVAEFPSEMAGKFFAVPGSAYCCAASSEWVLIGTEKAVKWYVSASRNVNFFTLSDWLSQTPVKEGNGKNTILSSIVNLSMISDSLGELLTEKYSNAVRPALEKHNFNYFTFQVNSEGGGIVPSYALYSSNLDQMPSMQRSSILSFRNGQNVIDTVTVNIPKGPFDVVDFRNGKSNTLEQLPDNSLRLVDNRGRELWKIPFDGPLCGSVMQIDYLKNSKLQMLMASGDKIYLLSRLGKPVKPFPVETGKEILLGPAVFDFKSDKDYIYGVLHTDNTVRFYDRDGNKAGGYGEITAPETILSIPEPVMVGDNMCWVVRTSGQTVIVNTQGIPVANFNKKRRLAPDTAVEVFSPQELLVTNHEGKRFILNVITGNFSKQ